MMNDRIQCDRFIILICIIINISNIIGSVLDIIDAELWAIDCIVIREH
jgi:hypothetical protein